MTAVSEPNARGQSKEKMAWFWSLDVAGDSDGSEHLEECKFDVILTTISNQRLVYRISWLRAKARKERWEEECILLKSEMEWTIRYYKHKSTGWTELGLGADDEKKHLAFAQSELWKFMHDRAKAEFDLYMHPRAWPN